MFKCSDFVCFSVEWTMDNGCKKKRECSLVSCSFVLTFIVLTKMQTRFLQFFKRVLRQSRGKNNTLVTLYRSLSTSGRKFTTKRQSSFSKQSLSKFVYFVTKPWWFPKCSILWTDTKWSNRTIVLSSLKQTFRWISIFD